MYKDLHEYIQALPPASQNNSRDIVRNDFKRIIKLNPVTASNILERKYGIGLDPDISLSDYVDESVHYSQETMEEMSAEDLADVELQ